MPDLWILLKIFGLFSLALISSVPDFLLVSTLSLTQGKGHGVQAAAGIATINGLYA